MPKTPISLSRLADAAKTRRSPLYVWMLENHDAFAKVVAEAVRPNWTELAKAFAEQGLNDAGEKPASAEVARQTWWRVRKVVEARIKAEAKRQAKTVRTPTEIRRPAQSDDQPTVQMLDPNLPPPPVSPRRFGGKPAVMLGVNKSKE